MKPPIQIGAVGIDTEHLTRTLLEQAERHRAEGLYDDPTVNRADAADQLLGAAHDPQFLKRYLQCLRLVVTVDINDFEIVERRTRFRRIHVAFKTLLWKLLRFYTYRLWSQQNQVNQVLLAAIIAMEEQFQARIEALEGRVRALENARPTGPAGSSGGVAADQIHDPGDVRG